ncbi:MAG: RNA polymerase sigma-70 factor [Dysgonamonadaceae bacterium]|jgi:RNA polymerase sigma-70 factor (ECF subfamily)|nr:RNA polymerase sigma-70 factor [Dysgonamonadaceae bacterium]
MAIEEKNLILEIQNGDSHAFKRLFYMYSSRLCLWSYKITGNKEAAEDIVQDFFIHYWERKETLNFSPSFSSYAYRSIYNASLNYLRDNEKYIYGYEITLSGLTEEESRREEVEELQKHLLKAIEELPERCREIFVMATLERKKYTEVASKFGISVNTVKVQVSKAYRILRKKIVSILF